MDDMKAIDYEKVFPPHIDPRASLSDALDDIGLEADSAAVDVFLGWANELITAAAEAQREACAGVVVYNEDFMDVNKVGRAHRASIENTMRRVRKRIRTTPLITAGESEGA